jgi:hypothetical protein
MSEQSPPNPNVSTFNNIYWNQSIDDEFKSILDKKYLRFPIAQGTERLSTANVNGTITINNTNNDKITIVSNTESIINDESENINVNDPVHPNPLITFADNVVDGDGCELRASGFNGMPSTFNNSKPTDQSQTDGETPSVNYWNGQWITMDPLLNITHNGQTFGGEWYGIRVSTPCKVAVSLRRHNLDINILLTGYRTEYTSSTTLAPVIRPTNGKLARIYSGDVSADYPIRIQIVAYIGSIQSSSIYYNWIYVLNAWGYDANTNDPFYTRTILMSYPDEPGTSTRYRLLVACEPGATFTDEGTLLTSDTGNIAMV